MRPLLFAIPLLAAVPVSAGEPAPTLRQVLDQLGAEVTLASPETDLSIAVRNLTTGEYAGLADQVPHVSASAAKVLWVAAALRRVGIGPVARFAEPVFRASDNERSGEVIDLIGIDAVNDWYRELGLKHTALTRWRYGRVRIATNSPREMGDDNYITAGDAVDFLTRLDRGELLPAAPTAKLRYWMSLTPREGCGGWLGTRLPERARATLLHKAGWLPPGCCSSDAAYNTLTEIGLIQVPGGRRYAVAILARRGQDYWNRQAPFVEHASCLIYRTIAGQPDLPCDFQPKTGPTPKDCD